MNKPMVKVPCEICLVTLNLTEQMSEHALHQSLSDTMKHYFHALDVSFYHVHSQSPENNEHDWRLHADEEQYHDMGELLKSADFKTCLSYQQICDEPCQEGTRYYVPIPLAKIGLDVLIFDVDKALKTHQLDDVEKLIRIFRNCDAHLTAFHHDVLTGLANRMALNEAMQRQMSKHQSEHRRRAESENFPAVCMLDIDFFKRVNDNFGHLYGDEVLLLFSRLMRECFRDDDQLFRYGGEEFIVVLNSFNDENTFLILNRFRQAIETYEFPQVGKITVSIGFSRFSEGVLPSDILEYADKALYFAKEHGRNQVSSYQALLASGDLVQETSDHQAELF